MKPQTLAVVLGALFALGVVFFGASINQTNNPLPDVQNPNPTKLLEKKTDQEVPARPVSPKKVIEESENDSTEIVDNQEGQEVKYTDERIQPVVQENLK